MPRRFAALVRAWGLLCLLLGLLAAPAHAGVTITFWSHRGNFNDFPHAFFTLSGTPDGGGAPVDASYGLTAKAITPAILLGDVAGRIDVTDMRYMARSDAQFSLPLSDPQYRSVMALVEAWGEHGDHHYNLRQRNCVTFVAEAMRRSGLKVIDMPTLVEKPHEFTAAIEKLNPAVRVIELQGRRYWAMLPAPNPTIAIGRR